MFYFDDGKTISVYFNDGNAGVWNSSNPDYKRVKELAKNDDWIAIEILHNKPKAILNSEVKVNDDSITITNKKGETTNVAVDENSDTLLKFIKLLRSKGVIDSRIDEIKPFLVKMFQNTFIDAVEEIYDFCTAMDFEITKDGNILAYKAVNEDLSSFWDNGKTKHVIGEYTEVENFCTDRNIPCAQGLHFCAKKYADMNYYGNNKIIVVEVDPRDIVSIPIDHANLKGRCRKYKTVGVLGKNGTLQTTNIEKMTDGKVQTVKTKKKREADKQLSKNSNRIEETYTLMETYNNVEKVASIMNISVETVKRNIRKYKAAHKGEE